MSSRNLRGTQPLSGNVEHSSSASSTTSAKVKTPADLLTKRESSTTKSLTPQSSSDDAEPTERRPRETRQTRQQKRDIGGLDGRNDKQDQDEPEDGDVDAEVTRCVCGRDEYPGPPVPLSNNGRDSRRLASLAAVEGLSEDAGGLFISCDTCGVWQHGGCVGIFREEQSPDNYYCEQCREDLHRVQLGARGQHYSSYLPIVDAQSITKTPRRPSLTKDSTSRSSREADAKESGNMSSAKRRSTMNSRRDLEEEEMLRKAIEQSKSDEGTGSQTNGQRRSKRGREEDADEARKQIKRQKTRSHTESPASDVPPAVESSGEEDVDSRDKLPTNGKAQRSMAAPTQREREVQERERQKNAERQEAAGRRSGRADRRRVDESEPTEEPTRPPPISRNSAASKHPRPQISSRVISTAAIPTTTTSSHKKKPSAKKGRVGRNQYTKDKEPASVKRASPRPPNSRGSEEAGNGPDIGTAIVLDNGSKPSKPRHMNPNRTSMNDLRKRAAGILEYITRTQMELAGGGTPSMKERSGSSTPSSRSRTTAPNGTSKLSTEMDKAEHPEGHELEALIGTDENTFRDLDSVQMMDVLTRGLMVWQKDFGKWGERT